VAPAPELVFDPFSQEAMEDPYPTYRRLLEEAPVYRNAERDFWALTRHADVQAAARDWETFSSRDGVDLSRSVGLAGPGGFLDMDPTRHDELRRAIRDRFTPKAILELEDAVRTHASTIVDRFAERVDADLAAELARPLPLRMICALLGFPSEDDARLQSWFDAMVRRIPGTTEVPQEARDAADAMREYIDSAAADRGRRPGEDVLSALVAAECSGEISSQERTGMCVLLFLAGISTAAGLISTGLWLLSLHQAERAALIQDLELAPAAVEELVRHVSPVQALARTATRDVELHGTPIPAGARVLLVFGAANRDPRRFPEPDVLDLQRPKSRHLGFGEGIHFCLGAPLARLQMRVVLEVLLPRIPSYAVSGEVRWMTTPGDRGLERLPVTLR
jgi:cytochrome P450